MNGTAKRKTSVSSFSIEPKLLKAAKLIAKRNRRTLSAHIQHLIEKDLDADARQNQTQIAAA